jgi:hypothetical protein
MNREASPLACDISAIPLSQRKAHLSTSRDLLSLIQEIRELSNGYAFRFAADTGILMKAAEFISLEKLCCPFLAFRLDVEAEGGPVWLCLTGREGVKEFIREEVNGLLGVAIEWETSSSTPAIT